MRTTRIRRPSPTTCDDDQTWPWTLSPMSSTSMRRRRARSTMESPSNVAVDDKGRMSRSTTRSSRSTTASRRPPRSHVAGLHRARRSSRRARYSSRSSAASMPRPASESSSARSSEACNATRSSGPSSSSITPTSTSARSGTSVGSPSTNPPLFTCTLRPCTPAIVSCVPDVSGSDSRFHAACRHGRSWAPLAMAVDDRRSCYPDAHVRP
jgi:hypothetical protein